MPARARQARCATCPWRSSLSVGAQRRDFELFGEAVESLHERRGDCDAPSALLGDELLAALAGHADAVHARHALAAMQVANEPVHGLLEFIDLAEGGRVDGDDRLARVG